MVIPHARIFLLSLALGLLLFPAVTFRPSAARNTFQPFASMPASGAQISRAYGQLPLRFEANQGQFDRAARFVARGHRMSLAVVDDGARIELRGGRHAQVAGFARVRQAAVYPGVDVEWYGNDGRIEHDFILAPGAQPDRIRFEITGEGNARVSPLIDQQGDLIVRVGDSELRLSKPAAWQEADGQRGRSSAGFA